MNRFLCAWLALLILCWTDPCGAAVFERDWKTPGDGLLTYDDANQREWLDLSQTNLNLFPAPTFEQRYQRVVLERAPGGLFEGFEVAKSPDVLALATSAGIDSSTHDFATNQGETAQIIGLLGSTAHFSSGRIWATGMLDEISPAVPGAPQARFASLFDFDPPQPFLFGAAGLFIGGGFDPIAFQNAGVMLYREVPEPASMMMLVIGIGVTLARPFWPR